MSAITTLLLLAGYMAYWLVFLLSFWWVPDGSDMSKRGFMRRQYV